MRQKNKPYGLKARFAVSILTAALISAAVFAILYLVKDQMISTYFDDPAVQSRLMERRVTDLQNYVSKNRISSEDLSSLKKWENKQPLILLELYDGKDLVYSSYYHIDSVVEEYMTESAGLTERNNLYTVDFGDKKLSAVMYMDISYKYYILGNAVSFALAMLLFILLYIRSNRELIRYIIRLGEDVQILEGGNLNYEVRVEGNDELTDLAKSMNRMRESFKRQLITEQELRQRSSKLISEMSHDLRTPLTGMMLYTEILKSGRYRDKAELNDYLDKIDSKARLMKQLSDNIFEYAIENRTYDDREYKIFEMAMSVVIKDIRDELEAAGFKVETELEWKPVKVQTREDLCARISGNIVSNIIKYADRSAPVFIGTIYDREYCGVSFINAVEDKNSDPDSHGIGLESVTSMMKYMGGTCSAEQTEDAFEVILMFRCI